MSDYDSETDCPSLIIVGRKNSLADLARLGVWKFAFHARE
jgi:hypothetical protein